MGKKVYAEHSIWIGTFLGGPFVATLFLAHNYRIVKNDLAARITMILGTVFTVSLLVVISILPEHISKQIPNHFIPATYTAIFYLIWNSTQKGKINKLLEDGYEKKSVKDWLTKSILSLIIMFGILFGLLSMNDKVSSYISKKYEVTTIGSKNNIVCYTKENVTIVEATVIGVKCKEFGYFTDDIEQTIIVDGDAKKVLIKIFPTDEFFNRYKNKEFKTDALKMFKKEKDLIQKLFPVKKVVIVLVADEMKEIDRI